MAGVEVRVDDTSIRAYLDDYTPRVHDALLKAITTQTLDLQNYIQSDKLSGQVLNVVTGNLRRSIFTKINDSGTSIQGEVYSSNDVKYGAIHEYGGVTSPHDIYPKNALALHFFMGGAEVFAKHVHHPGSHMPERSFMRSGLDDQSDTIVEAIKDAVAGVSGN